MPYPKQFIRLSYLFTLNGTEEVADTSLHISTLESAAFNAVAFLDSGTSANFENMATAYNTMTAATNFHWAGYSSLTGIKMAAIGTDGHYLDAPKTHTVTGRTGAFPNVTPQSSVVLSLLSGQFFGTANFGRMYLPHSSFDFTDGTPWASTATTGNLAATAKVWINSLNTFADFWAAGAGVVNISKVGLGTVKPVVQVGVGRLVDTQRRRRNKLTEEYSKLTL